MTKDGIRFYERAGLLESRRLPNGYRDFPPESIAWLHYVRTAQRLGFTLGEIAHHGARMRRALDPEAALSELLADKIHLVDERMAELVELRADLVERVGTGCPLRRSDLTAPVDAQREHRFRATEKIDRRALSVSTGQVEARAPTRCDDRGPAD